MNDATIAALNAVNRRFYRERASEFSASRERPWAGWRELFERHRNLLPRRPRVLDVGCGNGRFARFLEDEIGGSFSYVGMDGSPLALDEARKRLRRRADVRLVEHDVVEAEAPLPPPLSSERFDLVALFGVVHHVPGSSTRKDLLVRLSKSVAPGGLLVYTLWRFDRHERFRKKLVPWPEFLERSGVVLDLDALEPGDEIMTWGADPQGFRYCHAMSDEEADRLARSLPLSIVSWFDAREEPNTYYVLRSTT